MRLTTSFMLLVLTTTPAWAGTIVLNYGASQTITTNANQDANLERLRVQTNTRAGKTLYATVEDMLRTFIIESVQQRVSEAKQADAVDSCVSYNALTPAQQASIDAQLGGKKPCQ
jgi:hypothetical protein